jgi:hypothetical protein
MYLCWRLPTTALLPFSIGVQTLANAYLPTLGQTRRRHPNDQQTDKLPVDVFARIAMVNLLRVLTT